MSVFVFNLCPGLKKKEEEKLMQVVEEQDTESKMEET